MDHFWDLSTIYKGFDDASYQSDIEALNKNIKILSDYTLGKDFDQTASEYIHQLNLTLTYLYPLATYASLTFSTDTKNETALKYLNKMEEASALLTEPTVRFTKWLKKYDLSVIENSPNPIVQDHLFF